MSRRKIAIFGASGFVGSTLVERLYFDKEYEFTAFIHSYGNAARLTRLPIELKSLDILDPRQVNAIVKDHNVIVNCTRGGRQVMLKGLQNLMNAARRNRVDKFIHLGSMAIHGDNPPPESATEAGTPSPGANQYGQLKLKQDEMVFKLHQSGIPAMILCPSNISGPYSAFVQGAVDKLTSEEILLVDEGIYPTNLIHVDNLVQAILAAIESETGWGERYYINEPEKISWKTFYEDLVSLLGMDISLASVPRDEVLKTVNGNSKPKRKMTDNLKIFVSGEFREALYVFPAIKKLDNMAFNFFNNLNPALQQAIRQKMEKPEIINKEYPKKNIHHQFIRVQIRQVYHSPEKIIKNLNYKPLLNYKEGMETIGAWLEAFNIARAGISVSIPFNSNFIDGIRNV